MLAEDWRAVMSVLIPDCTDAVHAAIGKVDREISGEEERGMYAPDDLGAFRAGLEAELARAERENVPPFTKFRLLRYTDEHREVTPSSTEALMTRKTFDWVEHGYSAWAFEVSTAGNAKLTIQGGPGWVTVRVEAMQPPWGNIAYPYGPEALDERAAADRIYFAFQALQAPAPALPPFKVVMGHGNDQQWRILRDELRVHGYEVDAFEGQPRAGYPINEVLEDMARDASVALLVMTKADELANGKWHARQNVVHEVGFFQGRLNWTRAIVILEDGVEEFSNLAGTQQIRFPENTITAATGGVVAALSARKRAREERAS